MARERSYIATTVRVPKDVYAIAKEIAETGGGCLASVLARACTYGVKVEKRRHDRVEAGDDNTRPLIG